MNQLTNFAPLALLPIVLSMLTNWKVFTKYGEPGWMSLIPVLSQMREFKRIWDWKLSFLYLAANSALVLIPLKNPNFNDATLGMALIVLCLTLGALLAKKKAQAFGMAAQMGFPILLFFLPFLGNLILGFGPAKYLGHPDELN